MKLSALHILTEAEYLTLPEPLVVDGQRIDFLDMRFELYDNSLIFTHWVGRLPDGRFLLYTREITDHDPDPAGRRLRRLPDDWFDYALGIGGPDGNTIVKPSREPAAAGSR